VRGNALAASVTLVAFLSLFPLLLVGIAVAGFLQANSSDFAGRAIDSLGLHGEAASQFRTALETASHSRKATSVVGVLGLLWASLGFTGALRLAFNTAWQVPDRGVRDKAVGLLWLGGAGLLFAAGALLTAAARWLPAFGRPLALCVGLFIAFGLFLWTSRILPNVDVGWRALVPGAVFGAIGLLALQIVGAYVVPRTVASASALYGTLGIVFAILAWLVFFGRLIVYAAVLDVVLYEAHEGTVISVVEVPRHEGATRASNRSGTSQPTTGGDGDIEAPVLLVHRD
jgi:membrane protein